MGATRWAATRAPGARPNRPGGGAGPPRSEALIAGAAMGAAIYGLRPVAEMQFADFVYPAFNQIVSEISRLRYRSNNTFGLPLAIRTPHGGGGHGAPPHSQST